MTSPRASSVAVGIAAIVATTLSSCTANSPAPAPAPLAVRGMLSLERPDFSWNPGQGCWGVRGYDDIREGVQVVITDNTGATVAVGQLGAGKTIMEIATDGQRAQSCMFVFDTTAPAGRGFYGIEIGKRGRVQFPEAQLQERVTLTLD